MTETKQKLIRTIGHSTRTAEHFIEMLQSFQIEILIDVRSYPGSKRYPHFNKENLEKLLPERQIQYVHLKSLGGRRQPNPGSKNTAWRNAAFRGYADYMETDEFKTAINQLEEIAVKQRTAYMCSEAVWWRCHRSLISDFLKLKGWTVFHIMETNKSDEHSYTSPATIVDGKLSYSPKQLF
jgi:uncharacterized protein (DUF488 family)